MSATLPGPRRWAVRFTAQGHSDGFGPDAYNGEPVFKLYNGNNSSCFDIVARLNAFDALVPALQHMDLGCTVDRLNPCFDNRPTDVVGKHWGGGDACPACTARACLHNNPMKVMP